jgi:hypothetical protein
MNQVSKIGTFWQEYLSTFSEEDQHRAPIFIVGKLVRDDVKTTTSSPISPQCCPI